MSLRPSPQGEPAYPRFGERRRTRPPNRFDGLSLAEVLAAGTPALYEVTTDSGVPVRLHNMSLTRLAVRLEVDPEVRRYVGGPSDEAAVATLRARFASPDFTPREGRFVATSTQTEEVLGLVFLQRERGVLEVAYLFLPEHCGRGLATEAVSALLSWVATTCDDEEVIAVTQAANAASLRLLARLGFVERERMQEWGAEQVLAARPLR